MATEIQPLKLRIEHMTCINCQQKIEKALKETDGIENVNVSYDTGIAQLSYNPAVISTTGIIQIIEGVGYTAQESSTLKVSQFEKTLLSLTTIFTLCVVVQRLGLLNYLVPSQLAKAGMGYGMLFVIGLITSVHCIAMCGGINLSQCLPKTSTSIQIEPKYQRNGNVKDPKSQVQFRAAVLYNLGRVISYTLIGALLGAFGFILGGSGTGISVFIQGLLKITAGILMTVMGINMLGIFPALRKWQPSLPKQWFSSGKMQNVENLGPFVVGLLNGLMPCGPLQSMQIIALASGSPWVGGISMLVFSLGTVPLMLGLGTLVTALGRTFTHRVMEIGAILVAVMGLALISQGGLLSGLISEMQLFIGVLALFVLGLLTQNTMQHSKLKAGLSLVLLLAIVALGTVRPLSEADQLSLEDSRIGIVDGKQIISSVLSSRKYPNITVQAGVPVQWTITAPEGSINGCNYKMNLSSIGLSDVTFETGDNLVEFTPETAGTYRYSCWMGMITGTITVVASDADVETASNNDTAVNQNTDFTSAVPSLETLPAGQKIATDNIAIAKETTYQGYPVQEVTITLTDQGFEPAVIVVSNALDVIWHIDNVSTNTGARSILVPNYKTALPLQSEDNALIFTPDESFDFQLDDYSDFGFVKVVDDLKTVDLESVKSEVDAFEPLIWPPNIYQAVGGSSNGSTGETPAASTIEKDVQTVTSTVGASSYQPIQVQKGIPVEWHIQVPDGVLNGCNNAIIIPEYGINLDLKAGDNVIKFTPTDSGRYVFSCWMGMVRSSITVANEDGTVDTTTDDGSGALPSCCQ